MLFADLVTLLLLGGGCFRFLSLFSATLLISIGIWTGWAGIPTCSGLPALSGIGPDEGSCLES